jgi:PIF1-like helicase
VPGVRQGVPRETLKLWSNLLKGSETLNHPTHSIDGAEFDYGSDDADNEFTELLPTLTFAETASERLVSDLAARVGSHPSPNLKDIVNLVTEVLPLNSKQRLAVTMIFHHALRLQGKDIIELKDQFFLYIGGEGGTDKSRIIEAVRLGMMLLQRKNEMLVLGPTGNSASNVQGSTIHTGLDIAVPGRRKRGPSARVKALWTNKTMLVIDEISMVSSKLLHSINLQSNVIKNLDCNSTAVFGGLHVVIVLGDFHQFPPIQAKALWQKQESNDERQGQLLWHLFQNVVLLDEQMRQQSDPAYHALLKRARDGTLTQTDVDLLNTRVVTSLESRPDRVNKCVVRANKLRHLIIRQQIDTFARSRQQKAIIFPGRHTRWRKANGGHDIPIDQILEIQDSSKVKGPGLLFYTKDMPTAVLSNISTPLGIVNGAHGRAVGVVPNPDGMFIISFYLNKLH